MYYLFTLLKKYDNHEIMKVMRVLSVSSCQMTIKWLHMTTNIFNKTAL